MVKILVWRKIDESVRKKCKKIDSSWILGYGRGNDGMDGGVGVKVGGIWELGLHISSTQASLVNWIKGLQADVDSFYRF